MRLGTWAPLLILTSCLLSNASRAEEVSAAAKAAFERGKRAFINRQFMEASQAFREAYTLKPVWKLLFNIGQADVAAKRYGLALEAFEKYMVEGGDEVPETRQAEVQNEITRLRKLVGFLTVTAPDGAKITVDTVQRGTAPLDRELAVAASVRHTVGAAMEGAPMMEKTVTVNGGRTALISFSDSSVEENAVLPSEIEPKSSEFSSDPGAQTVPSGDDGKRRATLEVWGWVTMGVGGALLLGGGVTGGLALRKNADAEEACENGVCYQNDYELLDTRDALATTSTALLVTGGVAATAGIILFFVGRRQNTESSSVAVLPGHQGLIVRGRF